MRKQKTVVELDTTVTNTVGTIYSTIAYCIWPPTLEKNLGSSPSKDVTDLPIAVLEQPQSSTATTNSDSPKSRETSK